MGSIDGYVFTTHVNMTRSTVCRLYEKCDKRELRHVDAE